MTDINSEFDVRQVPVPPALDVIVEGTYGADKELSVDNPQELKTIDATVSGLMLLKSWLNSRGKTEHLQGPYRIETDLSQGLVGAKPRVDSKFVKLTALPENTVVEITYFQDKTFKLRVEDVDSQNVEYDSKRKPIYGGLTSGMAEIIGTYTQDFFDTVESSKAA